MVSMAWPTSVFSNLWGEVVEALNLTAEVVHMALVVLQRFLPPQGPVGVALVLGRSVDMGQCLISKTVHGETKSYCCEVRGRGGGGGGGGGISYLAHNTGTFQGGGGGGGGQRKPQMKPCG